MRNSFRSLSISLPIIAILVLVLGLPLMMAQTAAQTAQRTCPLRHDAYYSLARDTDGARSFESNNGRHIRANITPSGRHSFIIYAWARKGWRVNSVKFTTQSSRHNIRQTYINSTQFELEYLVGPAPVMTLSVCAYKTGDGE